MPRAFSAATAASKSSTAKRMPLLGWNGITAPPLLHRDADRLTEREWQMVVLDEAQFVKEALRPSNTAPRRPPRILLVVRR